MLCIDQILSNKVGDNFVCLFPSKGKLSRSTSPESIESWDMVLINIFRSTAAPLFPRIFVLTTGIVCVFLPFSTFLLLLSSCQRKGCRYYENCGIVSKNTVVLRKEQKLHRLGLIEDHRLICVLPVWTLQKSSIHHPSSFLGRKELFRVIQSIFSCLQKK